MKTKLLALTTAVLALFGATETAATTAASTGCCPLCK